MESVAVQLREVGIELELEEADVVAAILPKTRDRKANWYLRAGPPSKKAVEPQIALFNAGKGTPHWFEDDTIYKMWEDLLQISDPRSATPSCARSATINSSSSSSSPSLMCTSR